MPSEVTTPSKHKRTSRITDNAVYDALDALSGNTQTATAKIHQIGETLGLNPSTVWRSMRRLKEAGRIDYHSRPGKVTTYSIRGLFVSVPHA